MFDSRYFAPAGEYAEQAILSIIVDIAEVLALHMAFYESLNPRAFPGLFRQSDGCK
jgi:hypothetical protein